MATKKELSLLEQKQKRLKDIEKIKEKEATSQKELNKLNTSISISILWISFDEFPQNSNSMWFATRMK